MMGSRSAKGRDAEPKPVWATVLRTDEGYAAVAASGHGLVACNWRHETEWAAVDGLREALTALARRRGYASAAWLAPGAGLPPHLAAARAGLVAYDRGQYDALRGLVLDRRAHTPFTAAVMGRVQAIPAGQVMSYGEVAVAAGRPGAARAVGQAMATNTLAPVVPCHRVIAAGGKIGGFGPGIAAKKRLLRREGVDFPNSFGDRVDKINNEAL